ncbi:putative methyltransferase-domain-containing protein [Gaertneriomyces semiglobifer]|nr:putative methyltransferase-domain-containing protein [Gaertneriomyces semiglobifer]
MTQEAESKVQSVDDVPTAPYFYSFSTRPFEPEIPDLVVHQDPAGLLAAGVGATVWDSAICLAKYIEKVFRENPEYVETLREKRIVEVGAGTGLLGLAVATLLRDIPSEVHLTDREIALPLLHKNASVWRSTQAASPLSVSVSALDWLAPPKPSTPQHDCFSPARLILLADCVYTPSLYQPLVASLLSISDENTEILLAYEKRDFGKEMEFFALFGKEFTFSHVKENELDNEWATEDIWIFRAKRRPLTGAT